MVARMMIWHARFSQRGSAPKTIIRQMHTMVLAVFTLPDQPAAMTRPFSTATRRMPDTANSRSSTAARIQPAIWRHSTSQHRAAITRHLSASGSANLPKSEIWL